MSNALPPPPDRPGLGSTFKRPVTQLDVGNVSGGGFVHIGTDVPAVVKAWYALHFSGTTPNNAWIGMYVDANNYTWTVDGIRNDLALPFRGYGMVSAGVCRGYYDDYYDGAGNLHRQWSEVDAAAHEWANSLIAFFLDPLVAQQDFTINGVSQGRGLRYFEEIPAGPFTTPAAVGEVVAFVATPTVAWDPGRAYRVKVYTQIHSAVLQNPIVNLRIHNLAGQIIIGKPRVPTLATGQDVPVYMEAIVVNKTAAVVSARPVLTVNPSAATAVVANFVAEPNQSWIESVDVGQCIDPAVPGFYTGVGVT
jgi:hypothetical protein